MNIANALMFGDVCGSPGLRAVFYNLNSLINEHKPAITIINGENCEEGYGISNSSADKLFSSGANVITTGNHTFDVKGSEEMFESIPTLLRPANMMNGNPGKGYCIFTSTNNLKIGVINLHTPSGVNVCENLYTTAEKVISKVRRETPIIFIDLHGEYSWQKEAFAHCFDGMVTAVCGTHTHVQTADEKILPKGTAYITDMGMCGCQDSIIGGDIELSVKRGLTGIYTKIPPADGKIEKLKGVNISFDISNGKALSITRI